MGGGLEKGSSFRSHYSSLLRHRDWSRVSRIFSWICPWDRRAKRVVGLRVPCHVYELCRIVKMIVTFDAMERRVTVISSAGNPEIIETDVSEAFFFTFFQQSRRLRALRLDRNIPALDLGAVEAVALKQGQTYKEKSRGVNSEN